MTFATKLITAMLCLSSLLTGVKASAQTHEEKKALQTALTTSPQKPVYQQARQGRNEAEVIFSGLFLMYKSLISSQDSYQCAFYPSCSEYGLLAVKLLGIPRGMMSTFDRLTRCNGLSPDKYNVDVNRGVLIDHVEQK